MSWFSFLLKEKLSTIFFELSTKKTELSTVKSELSTSYPQFLLELSTIFRKFS